MVGSARKPFDGRRTATRFAALVLIYLAVVTLLPRPEAVSPEGWRLTGIFIATVAGLVLEPIAGGGVVLLAVVAAVFLAGFTPAQALSGYADPSVWLVMAAFFISRGLLKTGLARRVALVFVRAFGKTSVGVCYGLGLSDMVLASIIPSNSARSGGVTLPITRAIAELYGSQPGPTARKLGAFLMVGVYQCAVVSAATFLTGQASNPLAARMAGDFGHPVTWSSWALASIVPGLLSMAIVPLIVYRVYRPEISRTPEAAAFASSELETMGRMGREERILAVIFALVCGTWATSGLHGLDITVTALCGGLALLVKALAGEWAVARICVNALGPGYFATRMTAPILEKPEVRDALLARIPMRRFGAPADLAGAAVFLCSPASDYVTGQVLYVDGGYLSR